MVYLLYDSRTSRCMSDIYHHTLLYSAGYHRDCHHLLRKECSVSRIYLSQTSTCRIEWKISLTHSLSLSLINRPAWTNWHTSICYANFHSFFHDDGPHAWSDNRAWCAPFYKAQVSQSSYLILHLRLVDYTPVYRQKGSHRPLQTCQVQETHLSVNGHWKGYCLNVRLLNQIKWSTERLEKSKL